MEEHVQVVRHETVYRSGAAELAKCVAQHANEYRYDVAVEESLPVGDASGVRDVHPANICVASKAMWFLSYRWLH
jgi:hypothetical protein